MPSTARKASPAPRKSKTRSGAAPSAGAGVKEVLAALERKGKPATRASFARYGIEAPRAYGVAMKDIHAVAKAVGKNHALAGALWKSGWYEARLLSAFVAEPGRVSPAEMDRWAKDFDSWAVCDTACMHLFDRTPHAFTKIRAWATRDEEFVKRAAFALLASVALHDRTAPDREFSRCWPLLERAASDPRNFVKKALVWALRGIGGRNDALYAEALAVARRLAASEEPTERWVGKGALRELTSTAHVRRLKARTARVAPSKPAAKKAR